MFEPDQSLPKELVLKSADSHLYRIGLCVPTDDRSVKRSFLRKPLFILTLNLVEIFKIMAFVSIPRGKFESYRTYFGDYGELSGLGNFFNLIGTSYMLSTLCCMLIHYWNYKSAVKPTFLLLFKMMAGLVPPKTVVLTDKSQILWLIRRARFVFKAVYINNRSFLPMVGFLASFSGYLLVHYGSIFDLVIFGIPNSAYLALLAFVIYDIQLYQMSYFYLICVYLKMKLQSINAKLLEKKSKTSIAYIVSQLKAMNSLYKEINEYDSQFWSQYFFVFWVNVLCVISITIYTVFLSDFAFIFKIIVFYTMITFFGLLLFMVFTASSVNYEAKKSYKILNHLFVSMFVQRRGLQQSRRSRYSKVNISSIIKVLLSEPWYFINK